ncbi:MAG: 30S ribosomal protein S1 [Treponema sp.]
MVIAIDGPAGTGKSTIASLIARRLGVTFLNSGSFYRALTMASLDSGIDLRNETAVLEFCRKQKLEYKNSRMILNGADVEDVLHDDRVSAHVAELSAVVPVRHLVNERLREITKSLSIVCEGRDMTTVVFPNAECKFYLDASIDVQAKRRFAQGVSDLSLEEIKEAIKKRDEIDKRKAEGALRIALDALYIDTSNLTIDNVCAIILKQINNKGFAMEETEVQKESVQNTKDKFQSQLEESLNNLNSPEEGQIVEGTVIQVTDELVFLDVGCKSEGRVPVSEFSDALPKVGDKVQVFLLKLFGRNGPEISKTKADAKRMWKDVSQAFKDKTPIKGTISKIVKGGFEVALSGDIHAFLPISQSDSQKVEKPESLIGQESFFYVDRLYTDNRQNVVVNRRKYLEEQIDRLREEFFNTINIGDTVKATVKSFTSFGAFIDLGGFDGLLHINDMSWGHVARPKDFVKKGQEIELKVVRLDPAEKRINLSLKHFTEDPWIHFEEKYHVNDVVKGKVTKLTDFGAFIELEEGIEGLVHISEFSWTKKINKASDMVKIGDEIDCMILGYDIQAGRVSLGIKQVTDNPWDTIDQRYPVGTKVTGKVVKITNNGAFISLEEGMDAFLHSDDISWTKKVKHTGSELSVDQEIEAVVIDCDVDSRRIRVGIKQLTENPWKQFADEYKPGSTLEGEITSITDFGVFVKAPNGIEGLVNKANLSDSREIPFEEAVKKYNVGDKINVYVVDVNPDKEKLAFSVREFKRKQQRDEISQYMSKSDNDGDGAYTLGDFIKDKSN